MYVYLILLMQFELSKISLDTLSLRTVWSNLPVSVLVKVCVFT